MKALLKLLLPRALLVLVPVIVFVLSGSALAAEDHAARAPRDARIKIDREDLAAPIRECGEVRVIVGLRPSRDFTPSASATEARARDQDVSDRQHRLLSRLTSQRIRNVKLFRSHHFVAMTIDRAALDSLVADPEVISIGEDKPVYPVLNNTPGITRADKAWLEGFRGAGQAIAIIDSGVDTAHPFFAGKIVAEACFSTAAGAANTSYCPNPDPPDAQFSGTHQIGPGAGTNCPDLGLSCWHGTHVAGIAAGKTGVLSASAGGMAPDAIIIPIQVFQRDCSTSNCAILAFESDLVSALEYVYSLRGTYNIASVNMSLGGGLYTAICDSDSPAMASVIGTLQSAGIATVIASGNSGSGNAISFPGCISSAISVGSTTKSNTISSFSNSANWLSLLAPGSSIVSSVPGGGFGTASGTSMATPHVAGAWALLKSAKPAATVSEVLAALQNGGLPITDPRNGITKPLIQLGYDATTLGALGTILGHGNAAPPVSITSPANGATFTAPATVSLAAAAADSDGTVARVDFYRGATLIGSDTSAPYTWSDTGLAAGTYSYTAVAYDNLGAFTTSAAVTVTVTASTTTSVNVASAANGGVATASSFYNANYAPSGAINGNRKGLNWGNGGGWNDATASGYPDWLQVTFRATQTIGEIDVFTVQNNYSAPVEPTSSMTFSQYGITSFQVQYWNGATWTDVPGGNVTGNYLVWRQFTFTPVTTDRIRVLVNGALASYSRITEIEAWTATSGTANTPPTVSLSSPANGATFTAPATVSLAATAADSDGTVSRVDFYRGTTLIGSDTSASYTWSDTGLAAGTYTYTAVAFDNAGASTTSAGATVTVVAPNVPPTVSLTSPATGATFAAPTAVALAATAADSDGIARVDFYRGTTLIGSDTSAPYTWPDNGLAAGTYSYTAVAYDNLGAYTTAAAVTVTVTASTTTSVNVASAANGGVATASSFYSANYAPSGAINGNRKGLNWGNGGGWNDATVSGYPDWLQVTFRATQTIGEIDVFTVQNNYSAPVEPTSSMTFTQYGITDFQVQYWDSLAWTDVPGGNVTGNNLVWRKFTFTPVTTDRIRVLVNGALASYSRITEIEAWTAP